MAQSPEAHGINGDTDNIRGDSSSKWIVDPNTHSPRPTPLTEANLRAHDQQINVDLSGGQYNACTRSNAAAIVMWLDRRDNRFNKWLCGGGKPRAK